MQNKTHLIVLKDMTCKRTPHPTQSHLFAFIPTHQPFFPCECSLQSSLLSQQKGISQGTEEEQEEIRLSFQLHERRTYKNDPPESCPAW